MSYLEQHRMEGDKIYVYYGAEFQFRYYASRYGFSENDYILGISVSLVQPEAELLFSAKT